MTLVYKMGPRLPATSVLIIFLSRVNSMVLRRARDLPQ